MKLTECTDQDVLLSRCFELDQSTTIVINVQNIEMLMKESKCANKATSFLLKLKMLQKQFLLVVYFDQFLVAAHPKRWSKSSFFLVFNSKKLYKRVFCNNTKNLANKTTNFVNESHLLIWGKTIVRTFTTNGTRTVYIFPEKTLKKQFFC